MALAVQGEAERQTRETASVYDVGERAIVAFPPVELERGAVLAGRYRVENYRRWRPLVWCCVPSIASPQTPVALKILKAELAAEPRWGGTYLPGAAACTAVQHPNVCRVFDIGEVDGHRVGALETPLRSPFG